MGSKSTRTVRVHLPVQDEIDINKYARDAACCIFLQGDFYDILKLSHRVDIVEKILRKLNVIVTHDKFAFEYLDNDENSIDKLRLFNPTFKMIDEEELDRFLEEHDYKDADEDSYYNIGYECSDEYILVDMPKWTILVRNILKT